MSHVIPIKPLLRTFRDIKFMSAELKEPVVLVSKQTVQRKRTIVNDKVAQRMTGKPGAAETSDFTLHITEAGEEVRTTTRIIKGCFV